MTVVAAASMLSNVSRTSGDIVARKIVDTS